MFQQIHMILRLLPCGKLTWLLNMAIYSGFSH